MRHLLVHASFFFTQSDELSCILLLTKTGHHFTDISNPSCCDFEIAQVARRPSLPPPPNSGVTWAEYQSSVPGKPPILGRRVVAKASSKQFKATVAMSEDFPMKVDMLLAVLEVIAPQFKHFNKLRDFVKLKLPPGN